MGIVGHGAATGGVATTDDEVLTAGVAEMEAVGYALAFGDAAKVVEVAVESYDGHPCICIVAFGAVGVTDEVDINVVVGGLSATRREKYHRQHKEKEDVSFHG